MRPLKFLPALGVGLITTIVAFPSSADGQVPAVQPNGGRWTDVTMAPLDLPLRFPWSTLASSPNLPAESTQQELYEAFLSQSPAPSLTRHLLVGAGVGAVLGFFTGLALGGQQDSVASADSFWNYESDYYYLINGSVIGAIAGGSLGGLVYWLRN